MGVGSVSMERMFTSSSKGPEAPLQPSILGLNTLSNWLIVARNLTKTWTGRMFSGSSLTKLKLVCSFGVCCTLEEGNRS